MSGKVVTVQLGGGEGVAGAPVGSDYRGNLGIDRVTVNTNATLSIGTVRGGNMTLGGAGTLKAGTIQAQDLTITGTVEATSVTAQNLTVGNGGALRQLATTATTTNSLQINVSGTVTVNTGGSLDASSRGYVGCGSGVGVTVPNTLWTPMTTGGRHRRPGGRARARGAGAGAAVG